MIADLFAIFTTPTAGAHLALEPVVEFSDPQPREPIAHPMARPRPAYARPIYAVVATVLDDEEETEEPGYSDPDAMLMRRPIEPRDPVAHPRSRPHPLRSWARYPRTVSIIVEDE